MLRHVCALGALFAAILAPSAHAAQVAWTFTGAVTERFDAVSDDPIADLLGVPRAGVGNAIDISLRLVIDTAASRTVLQDDSAGQRFTYEDAIESATVTLNGVEFATLRRPTEFLGGVLDESEIRMTNQAASGATDNMTLTLGSPLLSPAIGPPLFGSYTVPFNQTIGGTLVPTAEVSMPFLSINISGPGMFSSADLPAANGAFDGANFVAIGVTVFSQFGLGFGDGSIVLEMHEAGFSASPVPLPAPALLLGSALAALALRRQRAV